MAHTFIIVDLSNLFWRCRWSTQGSVDDKVGISIHTVLSSIRRSWQDFKGTNVVFALEGKSWRKEVYAPYKLNRKVSRAALTPHQQEEEATFYETFDDFSKFIIEKTNCTVLQHPKLEADDLIAGWVQYHPNDQHVIISTDGDFAQLIAENVKQYNGVSQVTTTHLGYFDLGGKPIIDSKTNLPKPAPDPEWLLFEKCMRGDTSDNIFSAYPGVREKGTKNKIGLREAFADRVTKGYNWNNVMLQKWTDHEKVEHLVQDDYKRNQLLCDLSAQPEDIKKMIIDTIETEINKNKIVLQVGIRLLKFCSTYNLVKISEQVQSYAVPLNARYHREENHE
jgi:5'-3' exonuclease